MVIMYPAPRFPVAANDQTGPGAAFLRGRKFSRIEEAYVVLRGLKFTAAWPYRAQKPP